MNTRLSRTLPAVVLALSVFLSSLQGTDTCPLFGLRITEVGYKPGAEDPQFIELKNTGLNSIDPRAAEILTGGDLRIRMPSGLPSTMVVGARILILLRPEGSPPYPEDLSFAGDNLVRFSAVGALGEVDNLALYKRIVGTEYLPEDLVQYVAWGGPAPASPRRDAAVFVGAWPAVDYYVLTRGEQGLEDFGTSFRPMLPGGSLVWNRLSTTGWLVEDPGRSTPGADPITTPVAPLPLYPNNVAVEQYPGDEYVFHFTCVPWATRYVVVVEYAPGMFVGQEVSGDRAWFNLPLAAGNTYTWQVRAISDTGTSDWATASFTVTDPNPSEPGLFSGTAPFAAPVKPGPPRVRAGTFSGTIVDARSNNRLAGATVTVTPAAGGAPVVAVTGADGTFATAPVPDGNYTVRVTRPNYREVSGAFTMTAAGLSINGRLLGDSRAVANGGRQVVPMGAYKETTALAVPSPANPDQVRAYRRNVGAEWQGTTNSLTNLTYMWCWAVSSRMINRFYGGDITNDEVVLHVKNNRFLIGLIDGVVNGASGATKAECSSALTYALDGGAFDDVTTKPTDAEIVGYIDANRPLYFWAGWANGANGYSGAHIMTIRAYRWVDGQLQVELVNYDNNARLVWVNWRNGVPSTPVGAAAGTPVFRFVFVPPADAAARTRNAGLHTDTDGDGILDYDEATRWQALYGAANSLMPHTSDSDRDGIADLVEITAWARTNMESISSASYPDIDRDGLLPEMDEDTDNGGAKDGEEDTNFNGIVDPEETSVFKASDDGFLDVVFLIDTTGSMGPYINSVKARAIDIVNLLRTSSPRFRAAVVDYRDFPSRGAPSDYPARTRIGFSSSVTSIISAINGLDLGFGGDLPETIYSGIIHCLEGNVGAWRRNAKRAIIVMGDAPPLDPEPFTGYTAASVIARLLAGGVTVIPEGVSADSKLLPRGARRAPSSLSEGDPGLSGPVALFVIPNTPSLDLSSIVSATGGQTITGASPGEAFLSAIRAIQEAPVAALAIPGARRGATTITADARGSIDFTGCGLVLFEWDWDGDGVYDESSTSPVLTHSYGEGRGFAGTVRLRVTDASGRTGTTVFVLEEEPTIVDVTDSIRGVTDLVWTLDRQTGYIIGTITVGPRAVPLSLGFWVTASGEGFSLETVDGELPDGRGYADLTEEFLAAVRAVGNRDSVLDPAETVTFSPLRLLSRNRGAPPPSTFGYFAGTAGSGSSGDAELSVGGVLALRATGVAASPRAATIANLSARLVHGSGSRSVIPGFVIRGDGPRRVLVRASGPALAGFGIDSALTNPALRLVRIEPDAAVLVAENDDWSGDDVAAAFGLAGAFPFASGSRDAALVADLAPGHYTAVVDADAEGVTLVEVYGLDPGSERAELVNVSARAHIGTDERVAIAGIVVRGDAPRLFLVRGVGPTLGLPPFNLPSVLERPVVTVHAGGTVLATNAGWAGDSAVVQAASKVGAFPLAASGADAALVISLEPGAYTVQLQGAEGAEGLALVEVYALD